MNSSIFVKNNEKKYRNLEVKTYKIILKTDKKMK